MEREIALYTLEGVKNADISTHYFTTEDKLGLSLLRFHRQDCDDVVLLIHGLTASSDMFIMPEHYNLVQYLLDNGFSDVWTLDFRMSNRYSYNLTRHRYNLDDVALFDHPAAIEKMRESIGNRRIHVICHCQGSVSFMMSLFGKTLTGITSVISNSVSLNFIVPKLVYFKALFIPDLVELLGISFVNPQWYEEPGFTFGKIASKIISFFHRECDNEACNMQSFMWGTGHPVLYCHENLHEVTHKRCGDLLGGTGVNYHRHFKKIIQAGKAVKYLSDNSKYDRLPNDYFEYEQDIETPVLFMTGDKNKVFLNSNIFTHEALEKIVPGRHEVQVFPNYGHIDIFMGKNSHIDIFPRMLEFLNKHRK